MTILAVAEWLTEVGDSALDALAFVPIAAAVIGLVVTRLGWYRRTIGRRRDRYRRFARLGTNAQLSYGRLLAAPTAAGLSAARRAPVGEPPGAHCEPRTLLWARYVGR